MNNTYNTNYDSNGARRNSAPASLGGGPSTETVLLEVLVHPPTTTTTTAAGSTLCIQNVRIPCAKQSAQVSPVLAQAIAGAAFPTSSASSNASSDDERPGSRSGNVPPSNDESVHGSSSAAVTHRIENGKLVITLNNSACTEQSIKSIVKWCDYHVTDRLFEETTRFETFDEDEYELEQQRITELPCFFDWKFITDLGGGGERLAAARRADFYDVMIAADYLQLEALVLLGGKYICRQITGKSVEYVRSLLGIIPDLDPAEEARIKRENERILGQHK